MSAKLFIPSSLTHVYFCSNSISSERCLRKEHTHTHTPRLHQFRKQIQYDYILMYIIRI